MLRSLTEIVCPYRASGDRLRHDLSNRNNIETLSLLEIQPQSVYQRQQGDRHFRRQKALRLRTFVSPAVSTRVCEMYFALREFFAAVCVVSLSFDASRLGNHNRVLGYIGRPDGYGGWLPPQAIWVSTDAQHSCFGHINFSRRACHIIFSGLPRDPDDSCFGTLT